MPASLNPKQIDAAEAAVKLYRVSSFITGSFLLLLMLTWGLRRLVGFDLWAFGPDGVVSLEAYGEDGVGLPDAGFNLTVAILIIHGWLYVLYLFADFRIWTLLRWNFLSFLLIAAGGVVPLLSFFTERYYGAKARNQIEAVRAANLAASSEPADSPAEQRSVRD